jgi:hypothetical protein
VWWLEINVSEDRAASIFRVEVRGGLNMEVARSSEALVSDYQTTRSSKPKIANSIFIAVKTLNLAAHCLRGPYAKFVDSPYYSESELYGGAVTVSFSKYLPWQVMHFLQRSTHFSKMCCRPFITSKFFALKLPFHGWKSPEISRGVI